MLPYFVVAAGAVLGANLRFALTTWVVETWGASFPYATFFINVSGSLVIGFFLAIVGVRAPVDPLWRLFFVTGFLGAYTTFSSYSWEALTLVQAGAWARATLYVLGSNVLGLASVTTGAILGRVVP